MVKRHWPCHFNAKYTGMAEASPNSSSFHSTVLQSLETIYVSLNSLQIDQETCNHMIEGLKQKSKIISSENEAQEISPDSRRSGIGSVLSISFVKAGTKSTNYQREFECIHDSLN